MTTAALKEPRMADQPPAPRPSERFVDDPARKDRHRRRDRQHSNLDPDHPYFDRTLWSIRDITHHTGFTRQHLAELEGTEQHPVLFMEPDAYTDTSAHAPMWEAGRVREFFVQRSLFELDEDTGALTPATRELRFRRRRARLERNRNTPAELLTWYLDRTLWSIKDVHDTSGLGPHRISELRGGRRTVSGTPIPVLRGPHPRVFIEPDHWDNPRSPRWEAGRVREFFEQRGLHLLNLHHGKLDRVRARVGRPRSQRGTLSKKHVAGTPRKTGKKKRTADRHIPEQRNDGT